jgi:hypothetical protein
MSASQSRLDALADAATLRLAVFYSDDAEDAYRTGGWCVAHLAAGDAGPAYNAACLAARAAFRAVPGLRGEP